MTAPPARAATILIVDDESVVRSVIARMLAAAGYHVVEAADGEEALARAAALETAPALVISDVVMPRMSGPRLVATLRQRWPALRALLTSGYESGEVAGGAGSGDDEVDAFLQKPFTLADLIGCVQKLLGRPADGDGPDAAAGDARST